MHKIYHLLGTLALALVSPAFADSAPQQPQVPAEQQPAAEAKPAEQQAAPAEKAAEKAVDKAADKPAPQAQQSQQTSADPAKKSEASALLSPQPTEQLLTGKGLPQTPEQAVADLTAMAKNLRELNFTMFFTDYSESGVLSYAYSNFVEDGQRYASLTSQEGDKNTIFLKENLVGYGKYSLNSQQISDILPDIFSADIPALEQNYLITSTGSTRVAGKDAQIYELTNKYTNLYSFQIVLDQETKLPLKVIMVERDLLSNTFVIVKSFTVQHLETGLQADKLAEIKAAKLNVDLVYDRVVDQNLLDQFNKLVRYQYLPAGFKLSATSITTLLGDSVIPSGDNTNVTPQDYYTMTYYDGLFSFNVNVSKNKLDSKDHFYWRSQDTSFYTEAYAGHVISILGQIPINLAKGIANSMQILDEDGSPVRQAHPEGYGQRISFE